MANILVIGGGMVGSAMALDLVKNHEVTLADLNQSILEPSLAKSPRLKSSTVDVTDKPSLHHLVAPFDLVVLAVPGFLGFNALKALIEAGKHVVDISFFPEDSLQLNDLAREQGVSVVVDCGVAPGLDNLMLGHWDKRMTIERFECLVGGLPVERNQPFEYKAPFSPIDVIEEYTRPARYVEHGQVVTRPPLTDVEQIHFDSVGTLESFNSDGLRSLIFTMGHVPFMKEKTLRYPGHAAKIMMLQQAGFFRTDAVVVGDSQVVPLELTNQLLFNNWKLGEEEKEFTVMRVTIEGHEDGKPKKVVYDLMDQYEPTTQTSSMARTTGYTATGMVNYLLEEGFPEPGLYPPEFMGRDFASFPYIEDYLNFRGIKINHKID